jgi:geranylgeranyl diphosphate synthase, type I
MDMNPLSTLNAQNLQLTQESVKDAVNQFLETYFAENITRSGLIDANYARLWKVMHDQARGGGKRLRPYFVLLAYEAYGGENYSQIVAVAAAHELLHISLLVHDDIIDKDYTRHGQDNVAGVMRGVYREVGAGDNTDHFANSAALLAGDLFISGSYQVIIKSSLNNDQKLLALNNISEAIFQVGGGELLDTESSLYPVTTKHSIKIADMKTARYSFVSPLQAGAQLADASKAELELLEEFGVALGIAFQLADDLLGIYGDPSVTGKSNLSDIREGKQTYLMLEALNSSTPADKALLESFLGNQKLTDAEASLAREIVTRTGARDSCVQAIGSYSQLAAKYLERLDISDKHKQAFQLVIQKSTERLQ